MPVVSVLLKAVRPSTFAMRTDLQRADELVKDSPEFRDPEN
jgi:hypothetical protein